MARPLIALIDNDGPTIDMLRDLLTDEGYRTVWALSQNEALKLIHKHEPDFIILDLWLEHHLSGWMLLEILRSSPATKDTPVLLCSANTRFLTEKEHEIKALHGDTLEKPFDVGTLLAKVYVAVGPPRLRDCEA